MVKARLFSTFIRSIVTYGLENCFLNGEQLDKIVTTEGNILKKLLYLPNTAKSTELYIALGLETSALNLKKQKLRFFQVLRSNEYTNAVLGELRKLNMNTFISKIDCLVKTNKNASLNTLDLLVEIELTRASHFVASMKKQQKYKKFYIIIII